MEAKVLLFKLYTVTKLCKKKRTKKFSHKNVEIREFAEQSWNCVTHVRVTRVSKEYRTYFQKMFDKIVETNQKIMSIVKVA